MDINPLLILNEDDELFAEMLEYSIAECGIGAERMRHIATAHEAIDFLKTTDEIFDWILQDITFKNSPKDGYDVLRVVVEENKVKNRKKPKVTMLSMSDAPADIEKAKSLGAFNYVVKEFSADNMDVVADRLMAAFEHVKSGEDDFRTFM